jgi:AraC family transcriptional regulator of adaptative response/methylated-DNA-[protein]-cysteine methyltransferase
MTTQAGGPLDTKECWAAVRTRNGEWDGRFVYGVTTTGVYCRPSCPSRRPLRCNVHFYRTAEEAEACGLRACLRCRPNETAPQSVRSAQIAEICAYIDSNLEEPMPLVDLSARAGLSPSHFQRLFRAALGVTPKQYIDARRSGSFKMKLRSGADVTAAIYEAGYSSSSRAYERGDTRLGMTPGEYRKGGLHVPITYVSALTPLGLMMVGATDRGLCFLQFGDSHADLLRELAKEYPRAELTAMREPHPREFQEWMDALQEHLKGKQMRLELPLDLRATAFQMEVWSYLQGIPYGSVQSYGEVAAGIGRPTAARAVARACASNRVAIVIPCHRVIRGSGELGGYRWGLARKRVLIDGERVAAKAGAVLHIGGIKADRSAEEAC